MIYKKILILNYEFYNIVPINTRPSMRIDNSTYLLPIVVYV